MLNPYLYIAWFWFKWYQFQAGLLPAIEILEIMPPISKFERDNWLTFCEDQEKSAALKYKTASDTNMRYRMRSTRGENLIEKHFKMMNGIFERNKTRNRRK